MRQYARCLQWLTHWGRVTHIFVSKQTIIGSDNGLSPGRRQAIIWTKAGILLIQILGTNFNEILSEIHTFSLKKMHWKMAAILSRPQCVKTSIFTYLLRKFPHLSNNSLFTCVISYYQFPHCAPVISLGSFWLIIFIISFMWHVMACSERPW